MNVVHSAGMRALPPFDGLIAFDAALRHRSMTRAAGELGLTQSAISHRLKKLEGFVGARLLDRTGGGLLPTAAGVTLAEGLGRLLDEMAELRARSRASVRPRTLKIGLGSALANHWLVRRLTAFASAYPDIAIELCIIESDVQARAPSISTCRSGGFPKLAPAPHRPSACCSTRWFSRLRSRLCCRVGGHCGSRMCSARYRYCTRASLAGTKARNGRGRCGSNGWASRLPFRPGFASIISVRQSLPPCRAAASFWPGLCLFMMHSRKSSFATSCRRTGI